MKQRLSALLLALVLLLTLLTPALAAADEGEEEEERIYDKPLSLSLLPPLPAQGRGWRWSGLPDSTLTLVDGLTLYTEETSVTIGADVRTVVIDGAVSLTSELGSGLTLGDAALTLAPDASLTIVAAENGVAAKALSLSRAALSITAGGVCLSAEEDMTLGEGLDVRLSGDGVAIQAGDGVAVDSASVSLTAKGGGIVAGDGVAVHSGAALSIACEAPGAIGLSAGQDLTLGGALTVSSGGSGIVLAGALTVEEGAALTVTETGEHGITAAGLLTVDGTLSVGPAGGDGLVSTGAGLRLNGAAAITAEGDGIRCRLGITAGDASLLTVATGGDGIVSETGDITVAVRAGATGTVTAGGNAIRSGAKVFLCRPGHLALTAGGIGVLAQGDITVGGVAQSRCDLAIESTAHSIWSEAGHVFLDACTDCYFFQSPIRTDTKRGKSLSILEGAGLIYGIGGDSYLGVLRKDYTITPDKTPKLMIMRTLQIGAGHTVTIASGAKVQLGPLILGQRSFLVVEDGAQTYYDGPVTQVLGNVRPVSSAPPPATGGGGAPSRVVSHRESPDGSVTETVTDMVTGVVTRTTAAADGAVTVAQTRPDGVDSRLTAAPDGEISCDVTLPEAVGSAVVALPVPGADVSTATTRVLPDGGEAPVPFSDYSDGILSVLVSESGQLRFSEGGETFSDVPSDAWYADAVDFVSGRGLFLGHTDGSFSPDASMTCGMAIAVLHRLAGSPLASGAELPPDSDSPAYHAQALAWAKASGVVVDGSTGDFTPDALLTRQQLAVLLFRAAPALGLDTGPRAPLDPFSDQGQAGDWALDGLRWAVSTEVLWGRGHGILDPTGTATRAEVATMLRRYVSLFLQERPSSRADP